MSKTKRTTNTNNQKHRSHLAMSWVVHNAVPLGLHILKRLVHGVIPRRTQVVCLESRQRNPEQAKIQTPNTHTKRKTAPKQQKHRVKLRASRLERRFCEKKRAITAWVGTRAKLSRGMNWTFQSKCLLFKIEQKHDESMESDSTLNKEKSQNHTIQITDSTKKSPEKQILVLTIIKERVLFSAI